MDVEWDPGKYGLSLHVVLRNLSVKRMKKEYDFSKGKRGAVLNTPGKSSITIHIDNEILDAIREKGDASGQGYQTLINQVLREYLEKTSKHFRTKSLSELPGTELKKTG